MKNDRSMALDFQHVSEGNIYKNDDKATFSLVVSKQSYFV